MAGWKISGKYMETCNCSFLCPCITSNLAAAPTEGDCKVAIAMKIDNGEKDGVKLDGVSFIAFMYSPGVMGEGNLTFGMIVDEGATQEQCDAVVAIASGAAGGPMAGLAPLVANIAGVERRKVTFETVGMTCTVKAGDLVDQETEGVPSATAEGQPMMLDNTLHPVNARLALAHATKSHFHVFGFDWDDATGTRNGHYADFSWAA
jgi:hypothetical protein